MKKTSRLLSALLVLTMVLALAAPCAGAAYNEQSVVKYGERKEILDDQGNPTTDKWGNRYYGGLLVIGDSCSRGCGSTADNNTWKVTGYSDYYGDYLLKNPADIEYYANAYVQNSMPALLQAAVGCTLADKNQLCYPYIDGREGSVTYKYARNGYVDLEKERETGECVDTTFWNIAFPGQPLVAAVDLLGIEDNYDYTGNPLYTSYSYTGGDARRMYPNARDLLRTASLIVIEQGLCDTFFRAVNDTINVLVKMSDPEFNVIEGVQSVIGGMWDAYNHWNHAYPLLLKTIKEENPNAAVVLVNNFNPLANVTLTDEDFLPIGQVFALLTGQMNADLRGWAQEYGCAYADISNVETPATQHGYAITGDELMGWTRSDAANIDDAFIDIMVACHPTPEGHTYMYRQILDVLPDDYESGIADVVEAAPVTVPSVVSIFGKDYELPTAFVQPVAEAVSPNTDIVIDLGRFTKVNYVMVGNKIIKDKDISFSETNPYEMTVKYKGKNATSMTVVVVQEDGKVAVYTYQLAFGTDPNGKIGYQVYRIYNTDDAGTTAVKVTTKLAAYGKLIVQKISGLFKKK